MEEKYLVYHLHTQLSSLITNIDSVNSFNDDIKRAKEYGMTALAFSEHGNVYEWKHKKDAVEKAGMKYFHAIEAYITEKPFWENEDGENVVNFIKSKGIAKLDYVIGTHPHEDHIGGLDDVINNIDVDKIYLPKIQTNTKTYEDVLKAIQNKKISSFNKGDKFTIGDANLEVMTDSILDKKI